MSKHKNITRVPLIISLVESKLSKHNLLMNSSFRSYPTHAWLSKWTLEPRGCGTTFREKNSGYFFHTSKTVGRLTPNTENPEWALQIPIPQNSNINLLFNGFCGYFDQKKHQRAAEVFTPEPGVLWGRFNDIPFPELITEKPLQQVDVFQWLESDEIPALLAVRDSFFCLITKARIQSDAIQLAENYLKEDFDLYLQKELNQRKAAFKLFEHTAHHDSLAVISAESMMRAIRPPEGNISTHWSQSHQEGPPQLNTNELHALALAWRQLDIEMAEELLLGALKLQASSGAIPVTYAPHTTFSILEAPKPLLAKTAEKIWGTRKNELFIAEVIPLLRRHIQWLLHHFDPKRRGLHCWQNSTEMFIPGDYKSDLATVDLSILLLTEIEALNRLRLHSPTHAQQAAYFQDEHDSIEHNLQTQFWNEEKEEYTNAYIRNQLTSYTGFTTLTPLLWQRLPRRQKSIILDGMQKSNSLPGGLSVLTWRATSINEEQFPLLQQLFLLDMLKTADENGTLLKDFTRLMLQGFVEWHAQSIEEHNTLNIDPIIAAYIIILMESHHYRGQQKGILSTRLVTRIRKSRTLGFDLAIIFLMLTAYLCIHEIYEQLRTPPDFVILEAQMNNAYANKDTKNILENSQLIIQYYPEQSATAKLLASNILLIRHQHDEAIQLLKDVRKASPDSPGPMIALGLAYQLQGNFAEADKNYAEFNYLFDEIFPDLVKQIQYLRYLMQEGFQNPPKWQEIYRYQLMHEL
jgi:hypothetical protein